MKKLLFGSNQEDRADRLTENVPLEDCADRLTDNVPLEAGFFACLCTSGKNSPGESLLRYCCYPIALEESVRKKICSAFDVFRYDYGNSSQPLCRGDVIHVALRKGLEPSNYEDALEDKLLLR